MKRIFIVILIVLMLFPVLACGVPQKDYDQLKSQFDNLRAQNNNLQSQNKELQQKYETLNSQYQALSQENDRLKRSTATPTVEPYYMRSAIFDTEDIIRGIEKFGVIYSQSRIPVDKNSWAPTIVNIRVRAEALEALLRQYQAGGLNKNEAKAAAVKVQEALAELMQLTYDGEKFDSQHEIKTWTRTYVIEQYKHYRPYIEAMIALVNRVLEKLPIVQPG